MQTNINTAGGASRHDSIRAVQWCGDYLRLLDQRRLPQAEVWLECHSAGEVARAIQALVVRGAPAIGIAAAWAMVMAAQQHADLDAAGTQLLAARPTAVNLRWAVGQMQSVDTGALDAMAARAQSIQDADLAANHRMGELGAALIEPGSGVLTHCNTGSLATAGFGTALGVIRAAYAQGRTGEVFATETRPWLQGARLTMWELTHDGIPASLIADSAASWLMHTGRVQWIIVGADRIAANGDTANKIGSYQLAIAARHQGVKFMVVAPTSTVDLATPGGDSIAIELRDPAELTSFAGMPTTVAGAHAWNPVFDVVPADLIDVLVTERGAIQQPDRDRLAALLAPM